MFEDRFGQNERYPQPPQHSGFYDANTDPALNDYMRKYAAQKPETIDPAQLNSDHKIFTLGNRSHSNQYSTFPYSAPSQNNSMPNTISSASISPSRPAEDPSSAKSPRKSSASRPRASRKSIDAQKQSHWQTTTNASQAASRNAAYAGIDATGKASR